MKHWVRKKIGQIVKHVCKCIRLNKIIMSIISRSCSEMSAVYFAMASLSAIFLNFWQKYFILNGDIKCSWDNMGPVAEKQKKNITLDTEM